MTLRLRSISFNLGPLTPPNRAIVLRRNALQNLAGPEWLDTPAGPLTYPAAYALEESRDRTVRIAVDLARNDSAIDVAQVRAVGIPAVGQLQILGDVRARAVYFGDSPSSGPQIFELPAHGLASFGVGAYTVRWQWEWRSSLWQAWQPFAQTEHLIYVTVRRPTAPWTETPEISSNTQLPWTDVLAHACRWARGALTVDDAARSVTAAVNSLGNSLVAYDCPGFGATHYTRYSPAVVFECSEFLELLAGGLGNGHWVNCVDCAAITSTFANILGCELWQSGMYAPSGLTFDLNPIVAIGSSSWATACGWEGFGYHEVAWEGACTADNDVYDACLMVDADPNPTFGPHTALLPNKIRFGRPGDGRYLDRLCTPLGRFNCLPQPMSTRRRRPVI